MVALLGTMTFEPPELHAQEGKKLTFGVVGYSGSLDKAASDLIQRVMKLKPKDHKYVIDPKPVMLSYENAIAFAARDQLDIAFLTPVTYVKTQIQREELFKPHFIPIALAKMGGSNDAGSFDYHGKILYNPSELDSNLKKKTRQPTIALIRGSASGFVYPLQILGGSASPDVVLPPEYKVWNSQKQSESLDALFANTVNIAPVYEHELYTFLAKCSDKPILANVNKVKLWLKTAAPDVHLPDNAQTAEIVSAVYGCCRFSKDTESIPGDVIAVNPGLPSIVADDIRKAVIDLHNELAGPAEDPPSDVRCHFLDRRIVAFDTDTDKIEKAYDEVRRVYGKIVTKEPKVNDLSYPAKDLVSNIAYDIRFRRSDNDQYPAKIAVVLAGGGASGAYEAGALAELLEAFRKFKVDEAANAFTPTFKADDFRIHMFVGTSAGSINAIAAALIQPTTQNPAVIKQLWSTLDSNTALLGRGEPRTDPWIFVGYRIVNRGLKILLFAAFCCLIYAFFRSLRSVGHTLERHYKIRVAATLITFILAIGIWKTESDLGSVVLHLFIVSCAYLSYPTFSKMRQKRWILASAFALFHSFILIFTALAEDKFGRLVIGVFLVVIDIISLAQSQMSEKIALRGKSLTNYKVFQYATVGVRLGGLSLLFIAGPVLLIDLILNHEALLEPKPLENALVERYSSLMGSKVDAAANPATARNVGPKVLESLSRSKTELIITAADFTKHQEGILPKELYFFRSEEPDFRNIKTIEDRATEHWVSIQDTPDKLVDMVMASAAIFPGFPPRHVTDIRLRSADGKGNEPPSSHDLVDGGFIHNLPVQAALEFGATHVIIIDVHPRSEGSKGSVEKKFEPLGPNLIKAFDLLFDRAQSTDIEALDKQRAFLLAPQQRAIEVMDFDGHWDGFFGFAQLFRHKNSAEKSSFLDASYTLKQFLEDGSGDAKRDNDENGKQRVGFRQISIGELARERN